MANMSHATTLTVCYDQWAPMTIFPSAESSARGVVIDMLDQIYTAEGYKLKYYEVPLARGLDMVAEGLCDMLPEYLFSKNSEKDFVYATEATFAYASAFVVRRDDPWRYNGIQSIKGKRIATGPGWDYSSMSIDYQNYIDDPKNSSFVEVIAGYDDVVDRVFHMIRENRVDLYVDNELVLQHVLNQLNLNDDLKIVRPGLEHKLVEFPIFSKKMPTAKRQELIRIWNEGRLSLKGNKEKMILNKYNVTLEE
ncbi:MAG: transporter substrate-binding domain-containing protein [Pseudomonas sp.]|uniref:substrate-binding periplasmic protein n=1 Tax=Pseudomonas sp. TaxID=306 RepID=UPI00299E5E57|nr:transporter substrate-binding domain-containing protein [Pseudomonas sp.]MDX1721617.1 transporter substrate-binding domain-containing protein [Pseudomonas sp.]